MFSLAIVIPAYKSKFLKKSLASLEYQTNKNFTVYIGNDCSPDNIEDIVNEFKAKLKLEYFRFSERIGARNIVNQWNRCMELVKNEKWIWLFSDDDIADCNCVETFYNTIEMDNERFDVYRFNTRVINDMDELILETIESPFIDSSENMAMEILMMKRGNSMPDHIFSREVYKKYNGFVYTDYAQAADWATSILFSSSKGICTMYGAKVNWRVGGYNISGQASKEKHKKTKGYIQFLKWLIQHFRSQQFKNKVSINFDQLSEAAEFNLKYVIKHHYKGLSYLNYFDILGYYFFQKKQLLASFKKTNQLYNHINSHK